MAIDKEWFEEGDDRRAWLQQYSSYSGPLLRKFGIKYDATLQRFQVVLPLVGALKLQEEDLRLSTLEILEEMVSPLSAAMTAYGEDWVNLVAEEAELKVVQPAVARASLTAVVRAITDLHLGHSRVNCMAREVPGRLRHILQGELVGRVVRMFPPPPPEE